VAFGGLALVVAALGLYSVIGYSVTQRMHELGVRVALGARTPDILRLVVGQALRFAVVGVIVGIALSMVGSRWVQPLLFEQSARDPAVYALVALVLLGAAIIASASPAFRAAKADPNTALRAE
jgi:ABC-type antimicrobial peptide transport system permease subunit